MHSHLLGAVWLYDLFQVVNPPFIVVPFIVARKQIVLDIFYPFLFFAMSMDQKEVPI